MQEARALTINATNLKRGEATAEFEESPAIFASGFAKLQNALSAQAAIPLLQIGNDVTQH